MPAALRKPQLIGEFINAVESCGWDVLILKGEHPAKLSVFNGDQRIIVWLYIWNLTHGGYPRDPNELRIQVTGIDRFSKEAEIKTLILGWSEQEQAFAGFDVSKHLLSMTGRSPSFQIRRETLQQAKELGIKPQIRHNREIAIAFRPDMAVTYLQSLEEIHGSADRTEDLQTLEEIVSSSPESIVKDIPPGPRRVIMQQVQRKIRDARFRQNIMDVYDHRCAISGIQLDLLDASHIIPVEHPKGTDEIKNGICLSAIHHRAFDHGLIGIRPDYKIIWNKNKFGHLKRMGWDGGANLFKDTLRDQINLPRKKEHYPDPAYLLLGQKLRGWTLKSR
jgi:putative restriction endonuclease